MNHNALSGGPFRKVALAGVLLLAACTEAPHTVAYDVPAATVAAATIPDMPLITEGAVPAMTAPEQQADPTTVAVTAEKTVPLATEASKAQEPVTTSTLPASTAAKEVPATAPKAETVPAEILKPYIAPFKRETIKGGDLTTQFNRDLLGIRDGAGKTVMNGFKQDIMNLQANPTPGLIVSPVAVGEDGSEYIELTRFNKRTDGLYDKYNVQMVLGSGVILQRLVVEICVTENEDDVNVDSQHAFGDADMSLDTGFDITGIPGGREWVVTPLNNIDWNKDPQHPDVVAQAYTMGTLVMTTAGKHTDQAGNKYITMSAADQNSIWSTTKAALFSLAGPSKS